MTTDTRGGQYLSGAVLRSAHEWELILLAHLDRSVRDELTADVDPGDLYGAVVNRATGAVQSVRAPGALAFITLRKPGLLPGLLSNGGLWSALEEVDTLIRFGAIEIIRTPQSAADDSLVRLSAAALRYATRLPDLHPEALASRLYCWGRLPAPVRTGERWEEIQRRVHRLRQPAGQVAVRLGHGWRPGPVTGPAVQHWCSWVGPGWQERDGTDPMAKLYVSPIAARLDDVIDRVVEVLAESRYVVGFKVAGSDWLGERPDKLVIYARRSEDLAPTAAALRAELEGVQSHGVPFTRGVDGLGLISAAEDPPVTLLGQPQSWRTWVCGVLAQAIVDARRLGIDEETHALTMATAAGVDIARWAPLPGAWRAL